ncbi:MAG: TetR/AcrR family transcriptional regulator [Anaerolineae bacterium]|nr:TetR/AcrR family transcriptional regulator [Anaerolineae bacterium]
MTQPAKMSKAQQREATTQALIHISREMFTTRGFANTALEDIVQQAGVTRGALYHHFGSKEGLFKAVLEAVQADVARRIEQASAEQETLWDQLTAGCAAFLAVSTEPATQRILLVDAPAVLGWEVWREADAQNSGQLLAEIVSELREHGLIKPLPVAALTHLLSGAMNELALWVAQTPDPKAALSDALIALNGVLDGLKT